MHSDRTRVKLIGTTSMEKKKASYKRNGVAAVKRLDPTTSKPLREERG